MEKKFEVVEKSGEKKVEKSWEKGGEKGLGKKKKVGKIGREKRWGKVWKSLEKKLGGS